MVLINEKPIFYVDNDKTKPLAAAGIILYKMDKITNVPKFLMSKSNTRTKDPNVYIYEDFGGRIDKTDKSIEDVIAREAYEESNGILEKDYILSLVKKSSILYKNYGKYGVYICETENDYNCDDFGTVEKHDNINRTVEWVSFDTLLKDTNFLKINLHARLKFKEFFDKIHEFIK